MSNERISNIEEFLFYQNIETLQQRFLNAPQSEQQEIIKQLEPVAKKQTLVTVYRPQNEILHDLREAIENDGERAYIFFTHAFVSWYQKNDTKGRLFHWEFLDRKNKALFLEMLAIRELLNFDEEELYQFFQYCLSKIEQM